MSENEPRIPCVPDSRRLAAVEKLCSLSDPYAGYGTGEIDRLFVRAMRENIRWHAEKSPFYRRLLDQRAFDPESIHKIEDCARVPFVLASFFKAHEALSVGRDEVFLHLTSSGTTGQKSQVFFDEWSIRSAQRMVDFIFDKYGWVTPGQSANYLLYSYETETGSKLGTAYTDNFLCKYAPVKNGFYALRMTGTGTHDFDVFGCIGALQRYAEEGLPVRIFGFPAFLYFTVQRMKDLGIPPLRLSPDSLVFLGGGWKGHADQAINKTQLYAQVEEQLGIPNARLRDGFGSVEHCIPYVECRAHQFHIPVWSRVFIRDVRTLKVLPYGERGFLHFVSPYITSMPAQSVLMGDLASLHEGSSCSCGTGTPYFAVHGRAGTSKNKSCAVAAAELIQGSR
ncbi:MAG: acyl-protein synthase [Bdellovibrionales bacterium GWB1_55_8]|nr:MAG: acyl-protein synthase [Bdellovibrionales bacterium GWB1_55_8]